MHLSFNNSGYWSCYGFVHGELLQLYSALDPVSGIAEHVLVRKLLEEWWWKMSIAIAWEQSKPNSVWWEMSLLRLWASRWNCCMLCVSSFYPYALLSISPTGIQFGTLDLMAPLTRGVNLFNFTGACSISLIIWVSKCGVLHEPAETTFHSADSFFLDGALFWYHNEASWIRSRIFLAESKWDVQSTMITLPLCWDMQWLLVDKSRRDWLDKSGLILCVCRYSVAICEF